MSTYTPAEAKDRLNQLPRDASYPSCTSE